MNPESNLPYRQLIEAPSSIQMSSQLQPQSQPQLQSQLSIEEFEQKIKDSKNNLKDQIFKNAINYVPPIIANSIETVSWNSDGSKMALACWHEHIFIWNVKSNEIIKKINEFHIGNLTWHPKRNFLGYLIIKVYYFIIYE